MGWESLHAVLLDIDVPSSPHRSGGLLPLIVSLSDPAAPVHDCVFITLRNDMGVRNLT